MKHESFSGLTTILVLALFTAIVLGLAFAQPGQTQTFGSDFTDSSFGFSSGFQATPSPAPGFSGYQPLNPQYRPTVDQYMQSLGDQQTGRSAGGQWHRARERQHWQETERYQEQMLRNTAKPRACGPAWSRVAREGC